MKKYLAYLPILSMPKKEEVLYAYIAVIAHAISLVLVRIDTRVQKPIYPLRQKLGIYPLRKLF